MTQSLGTGVLMQNRRSYIDTLNSGRERRTHTPYGDINRTLQSLEDRLETLSAGTARAAYRDTSHSSANQHAGIPPRGARPAAARPESQSLKQIAREIERARVAGHVANPAHGLTNELKNLRNDLRQEMATGLKSEFDVLRRDIEKTYVAAVGSNNGAEISDELDSISGTIRDLANRYDSGGIDYLRSDIDDLKNSIEQLAREDTLRAVDNRWGEMDRRFDAFEQQLANAGKSADNGEMLDRLYAQLEMIAGAIDSLPATLPIRDLEERVLTLADAIDKLSAHSSDVPKGSLDQIEKRLDEISRAIVASSVSVHSAPTFDSEPLNRIEERLSALSGRLESLSTDRDDAMIVSRINALAERIEDLAGGYAENATPSYDEEMHQRLQAIAERLDSAVPGDNGAVQAIDDKLSDLVSQFESAAASSGMVRDDTGLEERLDEIVRRLEEAPRAAPEMDHDLIRRMESHLAALSEHISSPAGSAPRDGDYEQRGFSLEDSRDAVLETARIAAIEAVQALPAGNTDNDVLQALTGDLKELEQLARKSEERNSKTFEAIHDTLLKIVDRLGTLEVSREPQSPPRRSKADMPSLDDGLGEPLAGEEVQENTAKMQPERATPAAAAAAAAQAAEKVNTVDLTSDQSGTKSMLGGLARAIARKRKDAANSVETDTPESPEIQAVVAEDYEEIDSDLADQPLEPGSGAPDLTAIMNRVREERSDSAGSADSKTAQADFIAAARRAAQAAAAEAEVMKMNAGKGEKTGRLAMGGIAQNRRKTILMGATAVMILLAGYQLGTAFLGTNNSNRIVDAGAPAPIAADSSITTSSAPEEEQIASQQPADDPVDAMSDPSSSVRVVEPVKQPSAENTSTNGEEQSSMPGVLEPVANAPMNRMEETFTESEAAKQAEAYEMPSASIGTTSLREAAASGDPMAMFEVGARYAEGRGVTSNLGEAATWYERSAEMGFAPAQYRIGNMLEKGTGVDRDIAAAKNWYQMAAQQGNASAMHNLAVLFAMGADGEVDNDSAARWFVEAAELGVTDSQFNLGILSAKGVGVPQDLMESYKWFALAAKAGDKDAIKKRDEVAGALRPEQLEKARVAAELWKVKPVIVEANSVTIPDAWSDDEAPTTAGIDMKKAVKNIQLLLIKNGYNPGSPDGVMGDKTTRAISEYQKDTGLPVTGEVDETLVRSLLENNV